MLTPTLCDPTLSQPSASPVASAKRAASYYRLRFGWNPLPSHRKEKRPIAGFDSMGVGWEQPIADEVIEHWERYDTPNIQLMCGCRWGLAVVDLDGPEAWAVWPAMALHRPMPRTWMVKTGGGAHLYFRTPEALSELPSVTLWQGHGPHNKIQVLGDRSLVIAPPSHHVETGKRYRWITGPYDMAQPAELPMWVVEAARQISGKPREVIPFRPAPPAACYSGSGSFDRNSVVARLSSETKLGLARSWGLRLTGRRTRRGWHECHAINREDRRPSAGFEPTAGIYCEPHVTKCSFFDLAVALGAFANWQDCCNSLGNQYGVVG